MEETYKCHKCGQSRTLSFPAYGPRKNERPGEWCKTCANDRMKNLESFFATNNSCKRERDPTQQETREHVTSLPSPRRD